MAGPPEGMGTWGLDPFPPIFGGLVKLTPINGMGRLCPQHKGQLFSKRAFGVLKSTKKNNKNFVMSNRKNP